MTNWLLVESTISLVGLLFSAVGAYFSYAHYKLSYEEANHQICKDWFLGQPKYNQRNLSTEAAGWIPFYLGRNDRAPGVDLVEIRIISPRFSRIAPAAFKYPSEYSSWQLRPKLDQAGRRVKRAKYILGSIFQCDESKGDDWWFLELPPIDLFPRPKWFKIIVFYETRDHASRALKVTLSREWSSMRYRPK